MSQLNQAKREAKRLLKLGQENSSQIKITTLSEARKYIAILKGYHSWHDYEENLKRKDFLNGIIVDKQEIHLDAENDMLDYFLQDEPFIEYIKKENNNKISYVFENKPHIPIVLSENKKQWGKTERFLLNTYPCFVAGTTGAGRTETLLSMACQYVVNGEGLIYMDGKGDSSIYSKVFSMAQQCDRLKDIACINFMTGSRTPDTTQKISNSVDLINNMIGQKEVWKIIFGDEIGIVLNAIGLSAKNKNMLLDSQSLKSMVMLPNLVSWYKNDTWGIDTTKIIQDYLENRLQLKDDFNTMVEDDKDEYLLIHAQFCKNCKTMIEIFKKYEDFGVFSKTPEIDLKEIFLDKKILIVLMPALEKSWEEMHLLANGIMSIIWKTAIDLEREMNYCPYFSQNIIVDEMRYLISDENADNLLKRIPKNTNIIFGASDMINSYNINQALGLSKTIVIMKQYDEIPLVIKGRIVENAKNIGNNLDVLKKDTYILKSLDEGEAYVYMETEKDYVKNDNIPLNYIERIPLRPKIDKCIYQYEDFANIKKEVLFEKMRLIYLPVPKPNHIYLNRFPPSVDII